MLNLPLGAMRRFLFGFLSLWCGSDARMLSETALPVPDGASADAGSLDFLALLNFAAFASPPGTLSPATASGLHAASDSVFTHCAGASPAMSRRERGRLLETVLLALHATAKATLEGGAGR